MLDSRLNEAERSVQPQFSFFTALSLILLPFLVIGAASALNRFPDRAALPPGWAPVRFEPLRVPGASGAWAVEVDDPRFGGVSALALVGGRLLALTDSGVLVTLPRPGQIGRAALRELPAGPGSPERKSARDSESLARDPREGRWWVGFENSHSVWTYDSGFKGGRQRIDLAGEGWPVNRGIEALVARRSGELLLLPEAAREIIRVGAKGLDRRPLAGVTGGVTEAVELPSGRILVLVRELGLLGIRNRLTMLEQTEAGLRLRPVQTLAVGPLTNLEAAAAEPLPSGATRLWIMSDNDFSSWRRTILLAVDLPRRL